MFWPIIKSTWEKRIVVTREVEITRESRKTDSSVTDQDLDLQCMNVPPASKPWDCMEEVRPIVPAKMWITADQGLKLTPKSDISHSYWAGSGNKLATQDYV